MSTSCGAPVASERPAGHHHDAVGDRRREREVVDHEDDRQALVCEPAQQPGHARRGAEVEMRCRLVGDQDGRLLREPDRDLDAL